MRTKLASSSDTGIVSVVGRDGTIVGFTRSVVDAAGRTWKHDEFVLEPNARTNEPAELYTETHYALSAVLLAILSEDCRYFEVAAVRLRLWNAANGPMTFFNAMAVCLAAIVFQRSGMSHVGLDAILTTLLARAREHRHVGFGLNCGNNAYLQQVAIDTVLLPVARGKQVTQKGVDILLAEFGRYRTGEGFFFDLPRVGTEQERLSPPTYVMKMLFLLGICHELHPSEAVGKLFHAGISSALPLLSREGHMAYVGRTDNSPFAAGLTIFNLRKAGHDDEDSGADFDRASVDAERYYVSSPRTSNGMIRSVRFADPESLVELNWSRDVYSYDGEYSLASCAYALLACHWFPQPAPRQRSPRPAAPHVAATSTDLGLAKLRIGDSELILRTASEATAWDRRYLGPTILRYQVGERLLVGAISRTLSTDAVMHPRVRPAGRLQRIRAMLQDRLERGIEQLDGSTVGYLPILRQGPVDYLPYRVLDVESSPGRVKIRYQMLRLHVRGFRPILREVMTVLHNRVRVFGQKYYTRPVMNLVDSIEFTRIVDVDRKRVRIEDTLSGDLSGKRLLFSTRYLPGAVVQVRGLQKQGSPAIGWGSDGRQTLVTYERLATESEIRYVCEIESAEPPKSRTDIH